MHLVNGERWESRATVEKWHPNCLATAVGVCPTATSRWPSLAGVASIAAFVQCILLSPTTQIQCMRLNPGVSGFRACH